MNSPATVYHHHLTSLKEHPFFIKKITFSDPLRFAHMHSGVEMLAVLNGSCSFFLGGKIFEMNRGDLSFADSGIPHWHFSPSGETVEAIIANIRFETLLSASPLYSDHRLVMPFLSVRSGAPPLERGQSHLTTLLKSALLEQQHLPNGDLIAWSQLLQVISELVRLRGQTAQPDFSGTSHQLPLILSAVTFIQHHYKENISLSEIAAHTPLSVSRFGHLFSEIMQISPIHYRNQLRISHAMQQLTISDHTIEAIAFEAGFESISQFRQLFFETTGLSPSGYRKLAPVTV